MADYTPTQGRYLAYIHAYTNLHNTPPSEAEMAQAMRVAPPSVHQMVKTLEKRGLISREPGTPRSIEILIDEEEIPKWGRGGEVTFPDEPKKKTKTKTSRKTTAKPKAKAKTKTKSKAASKTSPANLYVLTVYLTNGPVSEEFAKGRPVSRTIEIRGDQTLDQLHRTIFKAFDRWENHLYEFQLGERSFDPDGPNYGIPDPMGMDEDLRDARQAKLDDLDLKPERVFGYLFDFGDNWFHKILVERIEKAEPTVTYPRVIHRSGESPPQYEDE